MIGRAAASLCRRGSGTMNCFSSAATTACSGPGVCHGRRAALDIAFPQSRGFAVERLIYGIKVTDDMQVSEPVRRVLSIDNGDKPQKKQVLKTLKIEQWRRHATDTGSPECQIAALTVRINALQPHVTNTARMDFACKRSYVKLLARRRKMLAYLKRKDFKIYRKVALETGLR